MSIIVAPSILSANFGTLAKEIEMLNNSAAQWVHVDVMDGVFVPNISLGFPIIKYIHQLSTKPLDVHLMIVEPDKYISTFKAHGAHVLTVHYEACPHLHRTIQNIKQQGMLAGVAINPHTPVSLLADIIADVDVVCVMSVNPGFGGQSFIENTYQKVEDLSNLIQQKNSTAKIEVDGGVNLNNAPLLVKNGAGILVAGNFIFSATNPIEVIQKLAQV